MSITPKFINEKEYYGIIKKIVYIDGNRGLPKINIGTRWIILGGKLESTVSTYIKVNDSIVKLKGVNEIKVYRKNRSGHWIEKLFK